MAVIIVDNCLFQGKQTIATAKRNLYSHPLKATIIDSVNVGEIATGERKYSNYIDNVEILLKQRLCLTYKNETMIYINQKCARVTNNLLFISRRNN